MGIVLAAAAFGLYLATLSRHHSADSVIYARQIDSNEFAQLVDPRHLLLHPLGVFWIRLCRLAGWSGATIVPLQVLNAMAGAVCVALLYSLARCIGAAVLAAVLVAAAFAVSGGLWLLSTEAEFVTVPLAVELWVLGRLLAVAAEDLRRPRTAFALGAAIGVATLSYMTAAALVPLALLRMLRTSPPPCGGDTEGASASRTALLALCVSFAAVLVGAVLAVVFADPLGGRTLIDGLGIGGYGAISWENLPRGIYAICRTLVLYPGLGMNDRTTAFLATATVLEWATFAVTYLGVAIAVCVTLGLAVRQRVRLGDDWGFTAWVALHAVFAFWWVPSDISFWMQVEVGWWLLVAVLASRRIVPLVALAAAPPLLLLINGFGLIFPHHQLVP